MFRGGAQGTYLNISRLVGWPSQGLVFSVRRRRWDIVHAGHTGFQYQSFYHMAVGGFIRIASAGITSKDKIAHDRRAAVGEQAFPEL